jgi:membrane protease subunit HflC
MKLSKLIIPVLLIISAVFFFSSVYIVDETEQVVITRFEEIKDEPVKVPGLYFRVPLIERVNKYPKNLQEWDGDKEEIPTYDKKYIWIDTFARWKISNPTLFLKKVTTISRAQDLLSKNVGPAVKNAIAMYPLIEAVRNTKRKMKFHLEEEAEAKKLNKEFENIKVGRYKVTQKILELASPKMKIYGIELVEVNIKRINYREDVRNEVYKRMNAERNKFVEQFRSIGRGEASKIKAQMGKELKQISSSAYKKAQSLRGIADAKATKIFADAFSKDPEFYSFIKSLDVLKKTMDKDTSIVFSTDSEFLKYLKKH